MVFLTNLMEESHEHAHHDLLGRLQKKREKTKEEVHDMFEKLLRISLYRY